MPEADTQHKKRRFEMVDHLHRPTDADAYPACCCVAEWRDLPYQTSTTECTYLPTFLTKKRAIQR